MHHGKDNQDTGPTGEFPEGKLREDDEGEIVIKVGEYQGKVVMDFGTEVKWIGMNAKQAAEIGRGLLKHAQKIQKRRMI